MYEASELIQRLKDEGYDLGRNPMSKLHVFRKAGLIAQPKRIFAGVRGSRSVYPDDSLDRLRKIMEWKNEGYTMQEIGQMMGVVKSWSHSKRQIVHELRILFEDLHKILEPYSKMATNDEMLQIGLKLKAALGVAYDEWSARLDSEKGRQLLDRELRLNRKSLKETFKRHRFRRIPTLQSDPLQEEANRPQEEHEASESKKRRRTTG